MRKPWTVTIIMLLLAFAAIEAAAQTGLQLIPAKGTSKVKLGYLKKSVTVDPDEELIGSNGLTVTKIEKQ
jgi:hypothetical protein